jgi:hypothetical protein
MRKVIWIASLVLILIGTFNTGYLFSNGQAESDLITIPSIDTAGKTNYSVIHISYSLGKTVITYHLKDQFTYLILKDGNSYINPTNDSDITNESWVQNL